MEFLPTLLSSIKCGRCESVLTRRFDVDGIIKYRCKCGNRVRALLTCTYCKKQFLNFPYLIRKTSYCSLDCYWSGTRKKQLKICQICDKEFLIKSYLVKQGFGLYCSKECWFSMFKEWKREVKCKQCKKIFLVIRAVYKKKPKYCSKTCKDNSEIDQMPNICRGCKVRFYLARSAIARGRGSFCTWKCYKKYKGESSLELIVRQQLEKLKEPFQQEMKIGKFRMDFYLPKRNLVIECDGEYWHMIKKIKLRDQRKNKLLAKLGYNILRLSGQNIIDSNFALRTFLEKI